MSNTLIHIILISPSPHHHILLISISIATLYALSLYISPRLLRRRALPLVIPPLASSPWTAFWLTGFGVKPCIRYTLHLPHSFRSQFYLLTYLLCWLETWNNLFGVLVPLYLVKPASSRLVVWPTMSCLADWSKCRHVTLIMVEWSTRHGRPCIITMMHGHVTFTPHKRCFCLRDIRLIVTIFIEYSLNLLISAILQKKML